MNVPIRHASRMWIQKWNVRILRSTSISEPSTTTGIRKVVSATSQMLIPSTPNWKVSPNSGIHGTSPASCTFSGLLQSKCHMTKSVMPNEMVLVIAE